MEIIVNTRREDDRPPTDFGRLQPGPDGRQLRVALLESLLQDIKRLLPQVQQCSRGDIVETREWSGL